MVDSSNNQEPDNQEIENPAENAKESVQSAAETSKEVVDTARNIRSTVKAVKAAKTAATAVKTTAAVAKTTAVVGAKTAVSTTGVGAIAVLALQIKQILEKLPIIGGVLKKGQDLTKKIAKGTAALIAYLLAKLAATIVAVVGGATMGSIIGGAILGPFGIVTGGAIGGYFGWTNPTGTLNALGKTIHYATHPWELAGKPWAAVKGGITSAANGIISGITNALSSAASSIGSFLSGAVSGTFSALGGIANFLTGLGGLSLPTSIVTVPLAVGVGGVGIGTMFITGFVTPAAFFTNEGEVGTTPTPGVTDYFTLTKTAFPNVIANQSAGATQQVEFTITLTAKSTRLISIALVDEAKGGPGGSIIIPTPAISCTTPMNPGTVCTQKIIIGIDSRFNDSIVTNTVRATVTPEGAAALTTSVVATVTVGAPPAQCPRGWPVIGNITQGPEGATSHSNPAFGEYEALDIGQPNGTNVYATVEGIVDLVWSGGGGPLDKRVRVRPTSCAGLSTVNYWHMSETRVIVGQTVRYGDIIGLSGSYILYGVPQPHTHYQFNESGDRSFRIESPYVPVTVPRTCDGSCGVTITTAP